MEKKKQRRKRTDERKSKKVGVALVKTRRGAKVGFYEKK